MTIRPPAYAELTEACKRAYTATGGAEYLTAISLIEEGRDIRQRAIWADGREDDAGAAQPPPDMKLAACTGTAWQRFRGEIQGRETARAAVARAAQERTMWQRLDGYMARRPQVTLALAAAAAAWIGLRLLF